MWTLIILGILILFIIPFMIVVTKQQSVRVIERLGKFRKMALAGLVFKIPFIDYVAGEISLRVQQIEITAETKTKDNVFVSMKISIQYKILSEKVYEAFYKLEDPEQQISSYVFNVVRAKVPGLLLDEVFEKKDDLSLAINDSLKMTMDDYGYDILQSLVIDIEPDKKVKDAMNEINASLRLKEAAVQKAEANKITIVKGAEAEAESKKLQGEGIANQRKAIVAGLKESVKDFESNIEGTTSKEVMMLVLMTQYFDTLKELGVNKTILIPHSPSAIKDIETQIRDGMTISNQISK